jgi:hypothetical protein
VSYLARVPLLEPQVLTCSHCRPPVDFPALQLPELLAGKVSALIDRTASRDLYDVARLASAAEAPRLDCGLARALTLHAMSLTDRFPFDRDPAKATDKFAQPTQAQEQELRSVLVLADSIDFGELRSRAAAYLRPLSVLSPQESEYLDRLATCAEHVPELLFAQWPEVAARARVSPVVAWKVMNLRRFLGL